MLPTEFFQNKPVILPDTFTQLYKKKYLYYLIIQLQTNLGITSSQMQQNENISLENTPKVNKLNEEELSKLKEILDRKIEGVQLEIQLLKQELLEDKYRAKIESQNIKRRNKQQENQLANNEKEEQKQRRQSRQMQNQKYKMKIEQYKAQLEQLKLSKNEYNERMNMLNEYIKRQKQQQRKLKLSQQRELAQRKKDDLRQERSRQKIYNQAYKNQIIRRNRQQKELRDRMYFKVMELQKLKDERKKLNFSMI